MEYRSGTAHKFTEEDVWSDGCQPNTGASWEVDLPFSAPTITELLETIKDHYGVTDEDMLLDSCEEAGRLDIQVLENELGTTASKAEIEQWKDGKLSLWSACYTYHIKAVEETIVALSK